MKPQLILLLSLAVASLALAAKAPLGGNTQRVLAVPSDQEAAAAEQPSTDSNNNDADKKDNQQEQAEDADSSQSYVFDISKKGTRGYDIDGRQEVVNIGPGLRTTADGQTQSRSGPRGRQRGAVLPHKYIVKLKNGADFSSRKLIVIRILWSERVRIVFNGILNKLHRCRTHIRGRHE